MPRGTKLCPSCSTGNGPRSFSCKNCGYDFVFKPKSKEQKQTKIVKNIDWRTLQKGDKIKVKGGPYYMNKQQESIPMGYRGKFIVEGIEEDGIRAYGIDKHSGFAYIYMGPDIQNKETGTWKTKHKIVSFKTRIPSTV